jgi:TM2 domain-containing membrane protein YozV
MERKSVMWAYGFLIFFGALGIHRFYLGKPESGILYLLTGGILGLGIVWDFFTLPFQVDAANCCECH